MRQEHVSEGLLQRERFKAPVYANDLLNTNIVCGCVSLRPPGKPTGSVRVKVSQRDILTHFSAKMRQRYGLSAALHRVSGHQTRPTSIDPQPLRQHYSCIICYPQQYLKEYRTPPSRDESRSPALPALRNAASPRPAKDGHTQVINSNLTWISQPAKALESGYTGLCSGVLCRLHY